MLKIDVYHINTVDNLDGIIDNLIPTRIAVVKLKSKKKKN